MSSKSGDDAAGAGERRMMGSLRDALVAAARSEGTPASSEKEQKVLPVPSTPPALVPPPPPETSERRTVPSAAQAVAEIRAASAAAQADAPQTRVMRPGISRQPSPDGSSRTQLVRGKTMVKRTEFHQDPVVGWLVIIGGPGLGAFRPVFEGNNTIGRTSAQRIPRLSPPEIPRFGSVRI